MIGYLKGEIKDKLIDSVIVLVGGVGYRVRLANGVLGSLGNLSNLEIYVHTHVKEDALDLYGFRTKEELVFFEMLISVSGVGPKTALLVMDRGVSAVKGAIVKADVNFFTAIPRLGTKNAQKIIIELKNKLGGLVDLDLAGESAEGQEAVEALVAIGYQKKEAVERLKGAPEGTVEEKIKWALRKTVTGH